VGDLTGDFNDKLAAHILGDIVSGFGDFRVEGDLDNAFPIAQVDENEAAVVAPPVDPARQLHPLPDMLFPQFATAVRL
jgi:hypothetical protein